MPANSSNSSVDRQPDGLAGYGRRYGRGLAGYLAWSAEAANNADRGIKDAIGQAGDFIYKGGATARDARDQYIRRLAFGNQAKINAANNAMRTDAKLQPVRQTGTGSNQLSADDELSNRLTRAKGISRLMMTNQNNGDMELMRDRLTTASAGRLSQQAGLRGIGKYQEIRTGLQTGLDAVSAYNNASKQNFVGGLAGIGVGLGVQAYQANQANRQPTVPIGGFYTPQPSTYTAPYQNYSQYTPPPPNFVMRP